MRATPCRAKAGSPSPCRRRRPYPIHWCTSRAARSCRRRWLRQCRRQRHRHRHSRRTIGPHLRAVLHHQAGRPGHRSRPVAGVRLRPAIRRRGDRRERGRPGQHLLTLSAARAGGPAAAAAGAQHRTGGGRQRHVGAVGRGQYRARQFRCRRPHRARLQHHSGGQRHRRACRARPWTQIASTSCSPTW